MILVYRYAIPNTGFPASGEIRESQGEIYFSGKSGKVREFVGFRENQGIFFYLCSMVRESQGICSDSGQTICNLLCFVSKYAYHESKFSHIFGTSLRSASTFCCLQLHIVSFSLTEWTDLKDGPQGLWVTLHCFVCIWISVKVRESQGKLALKSQGKSGIFVRAYSWEPWIKVILG